jgi:hypothetical protein
MFLSCFGKHAFGQVKVSNSTSVANPDAMLEIESVNKGFLLPRLALISSTLPTPLNNFVKGMVVYDTATINDISPGVYYSDGLKWIKLNGGSVNLPVENATVKKMFHVVYSTGETNFTTPAPISDAEKISLYRNGIIISFSVLNSNTIVSEIACNKDDEIRIIQIL